MARDNLEEMNVRIALIIIGCNDIININGFDWF